MPKPFMYLVVAELNEPGPTSFIASLAELPNLIDLVCFPSMLKELERKCLLCSCLTAKENLVDSLYQDLSGHEQTGSSKSK
jgi:hypothetical protein